MPSSAAIFRTTGENRRGPSPSGSPSRPPAPAACTVAGVGSGSGVGAGFITCCIGSGFGAAFGATTFSFAGASAPPACSITAIVPPTGIVCPSAATIFAIRPAPGDGISVSTLSVEISTSGWSSTTTSPSFTSHFAMVPSTTLSPICGIVTSIAISVRRQVADRVHDFVGARQDEVLERRTECHVRVDRRNAPHGTVEIFERVLHDDRRNLAADSARQPILVHHQHLAGLARGREYRLAIQRQESAQVEHLDREPVFLLDDSRRVERLPERAAVGDYRKVAAFLANLRDSYRYREIALGQVFLDTAIEPLVLEIYDRIAVANRTLHQPLRVVRRCGRHQLHY